MKGAVSETNFHGRVIVQSRQQPAFQASLDIVSPFLVPALRCHVRHAHGWRRLSWRHGLFGERLLQAFEFLSRETRHQERS